MPRFTDNKLAFFQLQLRRDYEILVSEGKQPNEIYQELLNRVHYNLEVDPNSALYGLRPAEQTKVYIALNTFFQACPHYTKIEQKRNLFVFNVRVIPQEKYYLYNRYCYCPTSDALFTWLMLDAIMVHSPYYGGGWGGHHGGCFDSGTNGETWAAILLVILAAIALCAAFIAVAYLFVDFFDNMERFWHNEGWVQAAITMLATFATGFATGLLTSYFLTAPLIALGLAAGLSNPIGIVTLAVVCLAIIGAGLGAFITNQIQDYAIRKANPNALDPHDAHRFALTEIESQNLILKGLDPVKVKCAIAAIRQQMGKEQLPSFLRRSSEKQELLNKVRQLRRGDLGEDGIMEVQVGEHLFRFDLRAFDQPVQPLYSRPIQHSTNQHAGGGGQPRFTQETPGYTQSSGSSEFFQNPTTLRGSSPYPQNVQQEVPYQEQPPGGANQPYHDGQPILQPGPIPSAPPPDPDLEHQNLEFPYLNPYPSSPNYGF